MEEKKKQTEPEACKVAKKMRRMPVSGSAI